jgi:hypothetical protein
MATYEPPVSRLTQLGRPTEPTDRWADYSTYGIGPEHVAELIRLVRDEELAWADSDTPEVYAQVHAWRAIGQLRAEAAIEPLLDLLAGQEDGEDWSDWVTEEVPRVLGMIGAPAVVPTAARLEQTRERGHAPVYYSNALSEIGKRHPELRDDVVRRLTAMLDAPRENDPSVNGFLISDLIDLKATDAWPVIEKAFVTGNVDESVTGGPADVKWYLGLGPAPPRSGAWVVHRSAGATAKDRAQQRAKQRKAEKRKKKRR